jgi:hypothetical protein
MRRWAIVAIVVGFLVMLGAHRGEPATIDQLKLASITEIQIVIEILGPTEREEGLTEDQLKAELMVQFESDNAF